MWGSGLRAQAAAYVTGDGYDIDRLTPAPAGDRFLYVPEPRTRDASCKPGEYDTTCGGSVMKPPYPCWSALRLFSAYQTGVTTRLDSRGQADPSYDAKTARLHLGVSWAPHRFYHVSVDVPLVLYQTDISGTQADRRYSAPAASQRVGRQPDFSDAGDVRLGYRVAVPFSDKVRAGLQAFVFFPTGDHERLTGDRSFRWDLLALFGADTQLWSGTVFGSVYAGADWRPDMTSTDRTQIVNDKAGAGLGWDYQNSYRVLAEGRTSSLLMGNRRAGDVSLGAGANWWPSKPNGTIWTHLYASKGIGPALGVSQWAFAFNLTLIPWMD